MQNLSRECHFKSKLGWKQVAYTTSVSFFYCTKPIVLFIPQCEERDKNVTDLAQDPIREEKLWILPLQTCFKDNLIKDRGGVCFFEIVITHEHTVMCTVYMYKLFVIF